MPPKNTSSSPKDPTNSVKVTYLQRSRKTSKEPSIDDLATPSSSSTSVYRKPTSNIKSKTEALFKAPENPPIRIVDFRTETSPKRLLNERGKSSASLVSLDQAPQDTKSTPSSVSSDDGPRSNGTKISQSPTNRSQTPASDTNPDNTSIADNNADNTKTSGNRIKRTEAERKQYFENQSECGSVEVYRAFCTRCREWVRLSSQQTYYVKPWEVHRAKCDQKPPVVRTYKDLGLVATVPFVVPRTEKFRKALLELDDEAEAVEPERVKCKACEEWVPLDQTKKYNLRVWSKHKGACHNNMKPSDVEQALERKLFFFCDAQFKNFRDEHTIECRACDEAISLKPSPEYDLDSWLEHKKDCHLPPEAPGQESSVNGDPPSSTKDEQETLPQSNAAPATDLVQSEDHTGEPAAPSQSKALVETAETAGTAGTAGTAALSTMDSERTLVPPSTSTSLQSVTSQAPPEPIASGSRKRPRDSSEDTDVDEGKEDGGDVEGRKEGGEDGERGRAARRPRLAGYVPEQTDGPTGLGLFLLPFQAFVEGFKASLTAWDS